MSSPSPSDTARRTASIAGAAAALLALTAIWAARASIDETVYVSGLGAASMPTAPLFNAALLLLAIGGVLVAAGNRGARAALPLLAGWTASSSLVVAGAAFAVASRVTCTPGCPVPLTSGSTPQDLVHVSAAVIGFAAACWAMLQVAGGAGGRRIRRVSVVAGVAVAAVAATGGVLSVLGFRTDVGALLEFVAMTVAVLWLAVFAIGSAAARSRPADARCGDRRTVLTAGRVQW